MEKKDVANKIVLFIKVNSENIIYIFTDIKNIKY